MSRARNAASIIVAVAVVSAAAVFTTLGSSMIQPSIAVASPARISAPAAPAATALPLRLASDAAQARPADRTATVSAGDTLSKIAAREYGKSADWPVVYWANSRAVKYPDVLYVGQTLQIPALPGRIPAPPSVLGPPPPAPVHVQSAVTDDVQHSAAPQPHAKVDPSGFGSFESCVISRESGGNADIWNASGHWGLFQFSASTWAEYGGSPSLFGSASASYQEGVFATAMAQGGEYNWAPYDGC
jgi:LysM repeat protein